MNEIKQLIRLHQRGDSIKGIARALSISKNTVKEYLRRLESLAKPLDELLAMECPVLAAWLKPENINEKERYRSFLNRAEYYVQELTKHKHVTALLLWEEDYRAGLIHYRYSQFCHHLLQYQKSKSPSMVLHYQPGEKWMIDFAGDKLHITDPDSGELTPCEILVMTMAYSHYTLLVACASQKVSDLISGLTNGLHQLGACPKVLVCDNLKSAVSFSDRYEPVLNNSLLDMANYYGLSVLPARVKKPKDKARVEGAVNHVYHRVYAQVRHQSFGSLTELNERLAELSTEFNDRKMKDYGLSRKMLFERDELPQMNRLAAHPYEQMSQYKLKVGQNGHVYLGGLRQYYSVPYHLVGQTLHVLINAGLVKIYHNGACIATHLNTKIRYTTKAEHMASHHRAYAEGLNPQQLIERAGQISADVKRLIEEVLNRGLHPEQNYKTCQGILSMAKKVGPLKLSQSCSIALESGIITYKYIERLCHRNLLDLSPEQSVNTRLPAHDNIRGSSNYQ